VLKLNSTLTSLSLRCNDIVILFRSHSIQITILVMKELSNYLKHSNQIHLSLCLNSFVNICCFISFSLTTDNNIDNEGVIKLSEALKAGTSLAHLNLGCNTLVASFHSHSFKITLLVVKEQSNYLKHSNQIHLSLVSIL
jgi:hypothetical protein